MKKYLSPLILVALFFAGSYASREQDLRPLSHEAIVNAPVSKVWAAFTTSQGLESWMTAHATIDLRVGGKMRTQYDPKGSVTDDGAIENTILSFEPGRMLSIKVSKAPAKFPFPEAIKQMWTVIYFEPIDEKSTRVREVSLGFGSDEESLKMREFFDRGNAYTMKKLQEHFAETKSATNPR